MISSFITDLRYSARGLRGRRGFVAVIVVTLAFGIGVNVAIFSLFQQILLRPLPVPQPEKLVNLMDPGPDLGGSSSSNLGGRDWLFSYPMFRDLERRQEPFVGIGAMRLFDASLSTGTEARPSEGMLVSGSYFPTLSLTPALGRLLGPQDDRADGQAESVVLSHAYWQSAFAGDPGILGSPLIVNGRPLTIVGVAPAGFHGTAAGRRASVFVPITFAWHDLPNAPPNHERRDFYWVYLFARLKPGVDSQAAAAALDPVYRTILNDVEAPLQTRTDERDLEAFRTKAIVLEPGARGLGNLDFARDRLEMLLAVSAVVLLLCCANVAGLLLVRGSGRTGEMAVRASVGASRGRLASLLVAESLLLALPAALLSLPVALLTLRAARGVPGLPVPAFDVSLDVGAAIVAIAVAVSVALVIGLFPARGLLSADGRTSLQGAGFRQTLGKGIARFRASLATVQIALSMALLALTGVFAQSLANIARIDLGFEVDSVVTFSMSPETSGYTPDASGMLFDRLEEELAAIPGVTAAASSMVPLLASSVSATSAAAGGDGERIDGNVVINYVSPGFFEALGMRLLAGRIFSGADAGGAPEVAIVNERFADRFGLGRDAVGQQVTIGRDDVEIVGVVADAKYNDVTQAIEPQAIRPRRQSATLGSVTFYVRSARPPQDLMSAVRATVTRVDPTVPIANLRPMRQQVRDSVATERFIGKASTAFAVLATALAALGLYGVLAYTVAQRSREIGLRFALGAPASRIRGMVLRQVTLMVVVGTLAGAGIAGLLGRAARGLLVDVAAVDPVALVAAAAVLAAVTLGASYVPARRASRVDPMVVLRHE